MWQLSSIFAWGQFHVSTIHLREANTRVKIMLAEAELQEDKVTWVGGRVHGRAVEVVGQLCEVQGCSVILEHAKDIRHHLGGHITSFLGTSLQWVACKWCVGQ